MAKRHLTDQQQRRIQAKQQALTQNTELAAEQLQGLVLANLGQTLIVETEAGEQKHCHSRQNLGSLVAGDRVVFSLLTHDLSRGVILAKQARNSLLYRPDKYKQRKEIAANLTQLIIVVACLPEFVSFYLDQYLVVAENFGIKPVIILNKIDLLSQAAESAKIEACLAYYEHTLGYPLFRCSALDSKNVARLAPVFAGQTSVIMGLSGVGKSSLLNALLGEELAATGKISDANQKGKHTTTMAQLYHLPSSGDLIDSPGIREFGIWQLTREEIFRGFIEFRHALGHCRFRNCQHEQEPGCAVRVLLAESKLPEFRVQNLERMLI